MDETKSIMRMTPAEGARLAEEAKGSPAAARTFLFYSAWRGLVADKAIPRRKREPLLRAMLQCVEVQVEA